MQDWQLIRRYIDDHSETAFSELVKRHMKLVYNVCLRDLRDPQMAEDATQVVFLVLARKAGGFRKDIVLPGWLFHTARFTAKAALRVGYRDKCREQRTGEAMLRTVAEDEQAWGRIDGVLNDALASLSENDRAAVLMRYFEELSFKEIGTALKTTEDTATRRTARAVDKLRKYLAARHVVVTVATLGALLSTHSVEAAPVASWLTLSQAISGGIAVGQAAPLAGMNIPLLTKGVIRQMLIAKLKVAAVIGGVIAGGVGLAPLAEHAWAARQAKNSASQAADASLLANVPLGPGEEKLLAHLAKYPNEIKSLSAHIQTHYIHQIQGTRSLRHADGSVESLPPAEMPPNREGDWAFSGDKLYIAEGDGFGAGGSPHGSRTIRDKRSFYVTESPKTNDQPASRFVQMAKDDQHQYHLRLQHGPLLYGYSNNGDWLANSLRKTGFKVVGSESDPKFGPATVIEIQKQSGPQHVVIQLWLAENYGLACVKHDERSTGFHIHWEATNLEKIGKFWMPTSVAFLSEQGDGAGMNPIQQYTEKFTDIHINDVPDSTFQYSPPAGTVVWVDDLALGKKLPYVIDAAGNLTPTNNPFP